MLKAVARATARLLGPVPLEEAISDALRLLGASTGVSRVYVFGLRQTDDVVLADQLYEWAAPGIEPQIDNPALQAVPVRGAGYGRWETILRSGGIVAGRVRDFPEAERALLEAQDIRSIIVVPIAVAGDLWGFIGFDECLRERAWAPEQVEALQVAADAMAGAIRRARQEDVLRASEARFRRLVENARDVVFRYRSVEPRGFEYVSPAVELVTGRSVAEHHENPDLWVELVHPDDLGSLRRLLGPPATRSDPTVIRLCPPDRAVEWLEIRTVPFHEAGGFAGIEAIGRVVTRREMAERELELSRQELGQALALARVGSWSWDVLTDNVILSRELFDMLGIRQPVGSSLRHFLDSFVNPSDRSLFDGLVSSILKSGTGVKGYDLRIVGGDGALRWFRIEADVVIEDGVVARVYGTAQDITQRKRAEEQVTEGMRAVRLALELERRALTQMQEADAMKNAFLEAVSHDLRTPLTSIIGFAETLRRTGADLDPAVTRDLTGRIANAARRLERMLNDLLDLDRIQRGMLTPRRHPVDVPAMLDRVVAEADVGSRMVEIEAEPAIVRLDRGKVERIIDNLLLNACKYAGPSARIWVRSWQGNEGLHLAVEDDGPGVPDHLKQGVFAPFERGRALATTPGLGIGLSIVSRLTQLHGGRAWVEDRPGGGASFRVFLPADPPEGRPSTKAG